MFNLQNDLHVFTLLVALIKLLEQVWNELLIICNKLKFVTISQPGI